MDTPALSNSIKIKNRVYKQFCKAIDPNKKRKLHKWLKIYKNLTTILTGVYKQEYYKTKKDSKKVWEDIRSIIRITNKNSIQNHSWWTVLTPHPTEKSTPPPSLLRATSTLFIYFPIPLPPHHP